MSVQLLIQPFFGFESATLTNLGGPALLPQWKIQELTHNSDFVILCKPARVKPGFIMEDLGTQ